jgi:hypothetical protein
MKDIWNYFMEGSIEEVIIGIVLAVFIIYLIYEFFVEDGI